MHGATVYNKGLEYLKCEDELANFFKCTLVLEISQRCKIKDEIWRIKKSKNFDTCIPIFSPLAGCKWRRGVGPKGRSVL